MNDKKNNIFVRILRWLLEEWIRALLLAAATLVLGSLVWIFRNYIQAWLVSHHTIKLVGWVCILVCLLILGIPIFLFYFIRRKPRKVIYKDENDVKNILELWFRRFSCTSRGGYKQKLTINFALCDQVNHLKRGSAEKFLPEIVEKSDIYEIESRGRKTIVIVRKGLTMKVGPDSPYGTYL